MMDIGEGAADGWRKSSRCAGGDCVEVLVRPDEVSVRDSKDPDSGALRVPSDAWVTFLNGVRAGRFDGPAR
jgi:hypothetical protein